MKLYKKTIIIVGIFILLLTSLLVGCGSNQEDKEEINNNSETDIVGNNIESKETANNTESDNNLKNTPIGFDGETLITKNFTVDITDYQVFKAGEEIGEYKNDTDQNIITFWFDANVNEDSESETYATAAVWMYIMEVKQEESQIYITTPPVDYDVSYEEDYHDLINRGEKVSRVVSYALTDLEKPVQLCPDPTIVEEFVEGESNKYECHEYPLNWRK